MSNVPAMVEQMYQMAKDEAAQEFAATKTRLEQELLVATRQARSAEEARHGAVLEAKKAVEALASLREAIGALL